MSRNLAAALRPVLPTEEAGRAFVREHIVKLGTLDAIPVLRRGFERPSHLEMLADAFRRAELAACDKGPPVFACFSAPSQVGKTTGIEVAVANWIARHPDHMLAYLPYGADLAADKSRRIRDDVRELGVELRDDSSAVDYWQTKAGGGLLARGIGGGVTGMPGIRCLVLDDLYKNRAEAESIAHRRRVEEGVRAAVFTRRQPYTSVIISFTRWAVDDLIGTLQKDAARMAREGVAFEFHRVPAVDDDGEPLITIGGRTKAYWRQQRALMLEDAWWSIMMGLPRPREGKLFKGDPPTYDTRPARFDCIRIGLDFAYSKKRSADHNAAVVLGKADRYYVLKVVRRQCESTVWREELKALRAEFPSASMHAYIGGIEIGVLPTFTEPPHNLRIEATTTSADKYSRAQPTAADWNGNEAAVTEALERVKRGEKVDVPELVPRRIVVPMSASWDLPGFLERTRDFTGVEGGVDDEQDALVAARDACGPIMPRGDGGPRRPPPRSEADKAASLI